MRFRIILLFTLIAALPAIAMAQADAPVADTAIESADKVAPVMPDFARHLAGFNRFGIAISKLALQQSQSDRLKRYAQDMIYGYTKLNGQLNAMLYAHDEPVPDITAMESDQQRQFNRLKGASKRDFNQDYLAMQVTLHTNEIALLKRYLQQGPSKTLKNYAHQALPFSQHALQQVKDIRGK